MDPAQRLDELLTLAAGLGLAIRKEPLGGEGGGLCKLRGALVLFIDTSADPQTRYENTLRALADLPGWDAHYLPPAIREDLDRLRAKP